MALRILLADVLNSQLLRGHFLLLLERLVVVVGQIEHRLNRRLVRLAVFVVVLQSQAIDPAFLVQVEQHLLLELVLSVVDRDRVVVTVKAVNKRLNKRENISPLYLSPDRI